LAERLARYAREQRWYRSKSLPSKNVELEDVCFLGDPHGDQCLVVLGVDLEDGTRESYAMPLRFLPVPAQQSSADGSASLIAHIELQSADEITRGALLDASSSRGFADALLGLLRDGKALTSEGAELRGALFSGEFPSGVSLEPRFLPLEQSNSTLLFGSVWLLKLLRKLEPGANMELEVGRFLEGCTPRPPVPRALGSIELASESGRRTLAVLSDYVENRGSAWSVTLQSLFTYFERVLTSEAAPEVPLPSAHPAESTEAIPDELARLASPYFTLVQLLAERTAELHRALGSGSQEHGFGQEPFSVLHQHSLYQSAHAELSRGFARLRAQRGALPPDAAELAARVLGRQGAIDDQLRTITREKMAVSRIRCHGDYHLGQVLFTGDDFVIIDFEGEPGRPVSERRYKRSPLRDVAGMLRSFAYAAESALRSERVRPEDRQRLAHFVEAFRAWVCVCFTRTYLAGIAGQAYCPKTPAQARLLLDFYELEKVLYEINYELNNRPHWLAVPLAGLARITDAAP
jgi:maltose alpha-D-glucosyltransferase/alpha-amylase